MISLSQTQVTVQSKWVVIIHFYETNPALAFDRDAARGMRLDIAAGTAVRFEPGQTRHVGLIPISGAQRIFGFNGKIMGEL